MCGILGWINFTKDLSLHTIFLNEMLSTLSHRGPDDTGTKVYPHALLGHKRLVVIDPEGGKQPMTKIVNGKEYTLVYYGELYNTEDLRKDLLKKGYEFQGYSDTEVLLTAYIEWGEEVVKHLNGIFAFGVWDNTNQTLFLARDHLGVKPLFYCVKNDNLLFASEIKALLKHPLIEPIIKEEGLLEIFAIGPMRSPHSAIFKDIKEIPPGYYLIYQQNHFYLQRYWKLEAKEHTETLEETINHTRELLIDAIERQLISDVPLGCFLSGGLDSSIIATITATYFKKYKNLTLNTYAIDYEENDKYFKTTLYQPNSDSPWVDLMSKFINSNHTNVILNNTRLIEALDKAVHANDLPGMADIDSSLYLFCEKVRETETVALSGECADEVFGGYPWYARRELFFSNTFPWLRTVSLRKKLLKDKTLPIETYIQDKYHDTIKRVPKLTTDNEYDKRLREMFVLNIEWFMVTLLNRKDRMSMAHSLEVRVPFADYRLVEYAFNIPYHFKLLNGREKGLLRESLKGILPDSVIERKKSPYPKTHHPQYTEAVIHKMLMILQDKHNPLLEIIDPQVVLTIIQNIDEYNNEPFFGQLMTGPQILAYLIQINTWLRDYQVQIDV